MSADRLALRASDALFGGKVLNVLPSRAAGGAAGTDLLRYAVSNGSQRVLRVTRPQPTVAFGRRDVLRPGFEAARERSGAHGFACWVRDGGGHAAAYDRGSLTLDLVGAQANPREQTMTRFADFAALLATGLRSLGVDARVGGVPDEYCPGRFSVNARGATKLAGTAQRVSTVGWLLSAVVTVSGSPGVRGVTRDVYDALGLPLDPRSIGCVADEIGDTSLDMVESALVESFQAAARESGESE